jgi:hypothetical protein
MNLRFTIYDLRLGKAFPRQKSSSFSSPASPPML